MKKQLIIFLVLATALFLVACEDTDPETVIETIVEQIEVTRIVEVDGEQVVETVIEEVEVTRVVEVPVEGEEPEEEPLVDTPPGEYANAGRHETVIFDANAWHADPENWNPFITDNLRDVGLHQSMIEPLFILNYDNGDIEPWLGKSMTPNETFDVWTLKLREGIKWSDGEDFNADDVVFSVELFEANTPDIGADVARWTESAEEIDDLTVEFTLSEPNPRYLLDNWSVKIWGDRNAIVPEHIWGDQIDTALEFTNYDPEQGWPVFTGPYLLDHFTENEIVYIRDDNWWGLEAGFQDMPVPKRLIWSNYGTEETRAAAAINNDLDAMVNTTKGAFEAIQARNPNFITWFSGLPFAAQDPCPRYLAFNTNHPTWSNPELRQAVDLAVDRNQIVSIAYEGTSQPSATQFVQYGGMYQYIDAIEEAGLATSPTSDPDAAKALIEANGWALNDQGWYEKDGEVLSLEILTTEEFQELRRIGDTVAEQLRKVGIDSQTRVMGFFPMLDALGIENEDPADDYRGAIWFSCGGVNEPYATLFLHHGGADAEQAGIERWSGPQWESFRAAVDQLANLAPGDPDGIPAVVDAYGYFDADMPAVPLTQATQLLPLNTTYWTNWPTEDNPYTNSAHWTQNAHVTIHELQSAP